MCLIGMNVSAQEKKQFNALLITKTAGWHHESINEGVAAIKALGERNFFNVTWNQDGIPITEKYLQNFQVIIFLNTTGDIFKDDEQKAIEKFIQSGHGYVGIHSASDTEYDWPWYTKMVGRMFHIHPVIQTAKLRLTANKFPGLEGFSDGQLWTDEWYEFSPETTSGLKYILAVDESSYNPKVEWADRNLKGMGMGNFHPIAWYHEYDGGRSFYTALGHLPTDYNNPAFLNHVFAGIYWAATGKK
ncbi:MAG: ThuA domain-containing protein [Bacteroidetes bacterium]|nr:ThuA domain-containing protein [Bacteroidota bacterium]MBU1371992.1 ThuA domain-containing protein [Bacteroidota bacterium]MBU1483594.1 ThuA domain-containing protein [Bacteroidota bacterium]MBU1759341.1 ThuA domain-containing protein [Bacteroidota bacterium]MBU2046112.1 ThuA domain-containing protein [Bacteroidota bacterium]